MAGAQYAPIRLFRVQLDDELLVQLDLHQVLALRQALDATLQTFPVHIDPIRRRRVRRGVAGGQNGGIGLAGFADRNHVAHFNHRRRDIALAAVDIDVAVAHHLAGLGAAGAEAHPEDDAVQAALQVLHQVLAGDALLQRCLLEGDAELAFQHAVHAAHLLFLAKLQAVAHNLLGAVLTMLPWNEVALFDSALLAVAALALEVEFHALSPALPANGANISCQVAFSLPITTQVRFTAMAGLRPAYFHCCTEPISRQDAKPQRRTRFFFLCVLAPLREHPYTRRFLGGRHPLCGIGVTSLIERTSRPAVLKARTADSRPEPGPETRTSTTRSPLSLALLAAVMAACWAANGVPLRDPRKPSEPALDQEIVLPS